MIYKINKLLYNEISLKFFHIIYNSIKIIFYIISLAICSKLKFYLPFSLVPFTFQTMIIFLIIFFEKKNLAFISIFSYIICGSLGIPVFSHSNGFSNLLGPTGGYILGFLFSSFLADEKIKIKNYFTLFIKGIFSIFIIYLSGFLGLLRFIDAKKAFITGILPFIFFDIYKLLLSIFIYSKIKFKGYN